MNALTNRDREYLRVIYFLKGNKNPIGPMTLAKTMGISKVCAFQKMHRLKVLGFGLYIPHKGLKLNNNAIRIIENDMVRHHIIETFLREKLGLSHEFACDEADNLSESISDYFFEHISKNTINNQSFCCDYNSNESLTPEIMQTCPWIKKSIKNKS
jgi:Mn-dependent DtxR family transcriptional regulator